MSKVLEHWQCQKCGFDEFHVVLEEGKPFNRALIKKIICANCGKIYENTRSKS